MHRLLLQVQFAPQATPPHGTPSTFEVESGPGNLGVLNSSDPEVVAPTTAHYATTVTETESGRFDEVGTYHLGGQVFQVSTLAGGVSETSSFGGFVRGVVGWSITDEVSGASGFVTSNIEIDRATGAVDDCQFIRLYVP